MYIYTIITILNVKTLSYDDTWIIRKCQLYLYSQYIYFTKFTHNMILNHFRTHHRLDLVRTKNFMNCEMSASDALASAELLVCIQYLT